MAVGTGGQDKYSNIIYDKCEQSGTNVMTFESVDIGLNIFDKVGLLISRIEYFSWDALLAAVGDSISFGLTASNSIGSADPAETAIITFQRMIVKDYGTAGNNWIAPNPLVEDFSTLPGGGLLVAPKPLYLFVASSALASAATVKMRMFFTIVKMKAEDYFELLEARQYFG